VSLPLPSCPHLPEPRTDLDWRTLNVFRDGERGGAFYLACLEYGHALWKRRLVGRAILCLDRAFAAELSGAEPELRAFPLPYAAMAWFLKHAPRETFVGNPRVHFQHYADRMNEPRRALRTARAWACWALARVIRPELPGDPRHAVVEPTFEQIESALAEHGLPGEAALWRQVLDAHRSAE